MVAEEYLTIPEVVAELRVPRSTFTTGANSDADRKRSNCLTVTCLLRTHLETFGTGDAGAVFRNERGGPFNEASARRAWARARLSALTEEQVHSPLARRPYDLRHAAASLWLNSGVPATEVARRLGHDVAVLLKIYAN